MTFKRFPPETEVDQRDGYAMAMKKSLAYDELLKEYDELIKERDSLKQDKPFLKIVDDGDFSDGYFIQYGDEKILFNLHKQKDVRSLIFLINKMNGFTELQCEYNDLDIEKKMEK